MKYIQTLTWEIPSLEYFKNELEWRDAENIKDLKNILDDYGEDDLINLVGPPDDYTSRIEE